VWAFSSKPPAARLLLLEVEKLKAEAGAALAHAAQARWDLIIVSLNHRFPKFFELPKREFFR